MQPAILVVRIKNTDSTVAIVEIPSGPTEPQAICWGTRFFFPTDLVRGLKDGHYAGQTLKVYREGFVAVSLTAGASGCEAATRAYAGV